MVARAGMSLSKPFGCSTPLTVASSGWSSITWTTAPRAGLRTVSPTTPMDRVSETANVHRRRPCRPRGRRQLPGVLAPLRRGHPEAVLGHVGPDGPMAPGNPRADLLSAPPVRRHVAIRRNPRSAVDGDRGVFEHRAVLRPDPGRAAPARLSAIGALHRLHAPRGPVGGAPRSLAAMAGAATEHPDTPRADLRSGRRRGDDPQGDAE